LQQLVLQVQGVEAEMSEAVVVSMEAEAEAVEAVSVEEQLDVTMSEVVLAEDDDDDDRKRETREPRSFRPREASLEKREENITGVGFGCLICGKTGYTRVKDDCRKKMNR